MKYPKPRPEPLQRRARGKEIAFSASGASGIALTAAAQPISCLQHAHAENSFCTASRTIPPFSESPSVFAIFHHLPLCWPVFVCFVFPLYAFVFCSCTPFRFSSLTAEKPDLLRSKGSRRRGLENLKLWPSVIDNLRTAESLWTCLKLRLITFLNVEQDCFPLRPLSFVRHQLIRNQRNGISCKFAEYFSQGIPSG